MNSAKPSRTFDPITAILAGTAAAIVIAGTVITVAPRPAVAKQEFSQKTGKPCGTCHTTPPKLNDVGKRYKAKGYKF